MSGAQAGPDAPAAFHTLPVMPLGVLFDLDGTLIDSEPRSFQVWTLLFESYGVPHTPQLLRGFVGRRGADVLGELSDLFPGASVDDIIARIRSFQLRTDLPPVGPLPGSVAFARELADGGVDLGLVTSATRAWAEQLLTQIGLRDRFGVLVSASDVTVGKPDPEGYRLGTSLLGHPPERVVAFEDAPAGVAAAKAAGLTCVALTTTHHASELAHADLVVADLSHVRLPTGEPLTGASAGTGAHEDAEEGSSRG
ncbi:sugar-phosphatase [Allonocardiopsis opalescens]|uniref:Sugar-phosphatase n=1 Tax=Allonocardiopsis opalescens TaxID=1144618 RepID=A0A2T0QCD1_9ACTN|nr:sugar-phosphatase [Allonocardiopsis opalescens]